MDGISQVHVGFTSGRRANKVVRKWSEEQTDLFAAVLSLKMSRDGEESCWSEELETLAVKKSSNEKLFREIQAALEEELVKIGQSVRAPDEEATFSIPQLRAKYKWLKREWKIIQNKFGYGLLTKEELKTPGWYKYLDPLFSVYLTSSKDDRDERPTMVADENGSLIQNGESNTDGVSDTNHTSTNLNGERSCVVTLPNCSTSALNRPENFEVDEQEEIRESNINKEQVNVPSNDILRAAPTAITRVPNTMRPRDGQTFQRVNLRTEDAVTAIPPRKIRKLDGNDNELCLPSGSNANNVKQCACRCDGNNYVEIIKYLLDAEERRERMFVSFQKEQAEANRQHEFKMAQFFAQSSSQQQVLTKQISQILQAVSKTTEDD